MTMSWITLLCNRNPDLPIRFTQPELCDPNVIQYSGYLDINSKDVHYFFWFFESKKIEYAPFTLWLNGGPGCSSLVVYLPGQVLPAGTGFSYGTRTINRTEDGAYYVYECLQLFFEMFPQYRKHPFHMFGESYAGRFVSEYY
ncbi:Alpha/Beta hydrolase protein [Circinella umbellata]|nr:Alpha/Beta hydrolase protein [Circinella umbellata]